jgi:hypothetical protein
MNNLFIVMNHLTVKVQNIEWFIIISICQQIKKKILLRLVTQFL